MKKTLQIKLLFLVFSMVFLINKTFAQSYCTSSSSSTAIYVNSIFFPIAIPPGTPSANNYIYAFNDTQQSSPLATNYYNGTGSSIFTMRSDTTNTIGISVYFNGSEAGKTGYYVVYIDYNHNGSFGDTGEQVISGSMTFPASFTSGGNTTTTAVIPFPTSYLGGTTRMRVMIKEGSAPSPCESSFTGETEDWTVTMPTPPGPALSNMESSALSFTEGAGATQITNTLTVSDATASTLASGTVSITGNFSSGQDVLAFTNTSSTTFGNIAASYNSTTGVLTLTSSGSTATVAQWQAALRAVKYNNTSQDPSSSTRTVSFQVNDGTYTSPTATRQITVTPVNDPPTISATGSNPTFTEGGSAVTLFSSAAVSTVESGQLITTMKLTVSNLADGASEILGIDGSSVALTNGNAATTSTNSMSVSVSVSGTTATVTASSSAGVSTTTVQNIINGLTYKDSNSYASGSRVITITSLTDNGGTANGGNNTTTASIASTVSISITPPSTGNGSTNLPYEIANLHDLFWLSNTSSVWGKSFIQTADINAAATKNWNSGAGFLPIANSSVYYFTGTYDGQGHIIDSLNINRPSANGVGLFVGLSNSTSFVKNLGLTNVKVTGSDYVGAVAGYISNGTIENCYATGSVSGLDTGGLIGDIDAGTVKNSYAVVRVSGTSGTFNNGGLIGINKNATVQNCYALGNVYGVNKAGGLVGENNGTIQNCYASGHVSGTTYIGGLIGETAPFLLGGPGFPSSSNTVENSFWNTDTIATGIGTSSGGTIVNVSGKTTAEMKALSTFTSAGWDFKGETANGTNDYWNINTYENSGYPFLSWQYPNDPGQTIPLGSGTSVDPYQIANLANLYWLSQNASSWGSSFIQTADIDATATKNWESGAGFSPIGNQTTNFTGKYNGQSHTITGLYISRSSTSYVGLFGYATDSLQHLGLVNSSISGNNVTGALVGDNAGTVTYAYASGKVTNAQNIAGGLVGKSSGSVSYSYANDTVKGLSSGLSSTAIGGLVGVSASGSTISNSYATGNVSGGSDVGGLVGQLSGTLSNAYSLGVATATTNSGGLIGGIYTPGTISNSFWNTTIAGTTGIGTGSSSGVTGKTTTEMKTEFTFTAAGWDFQGETANGTANIWGINPSVNSGYPFLSFQGYSSAVAISSFSPASGPVGTTVTIKSTGAYFNATANKNVVYFGATKAAVTSVTDTSLVATVPDGADYRYITVTDTTTGLTTSSAKPFIVTFTSSGKLSTKVDYATGLTPESVTTGDFNGDGIPDLAVANIGSTSVSILLGKKDGSFATKVDYTTGISPFMVAVGDFNGDGIFDLAVANMGSNTVSVLLGNGDGTFKTRVDYAAGNTPAGVTTGDFNGDGKTDLVVTNYQSNTVSILLGKGDGTFYPNVDYAVGQNPSSVVTGDFNGDGKTDLAVVNHASFNISVLLGNGDGTFATQQTFATNDYSSYITVGDFNGDGKLDLAVTRSASVSVFLGNGDGTFASPANYSVGSTPQGIITADLNGDGIPDLVVANNGSNNVSVLTGKGDGTFAAQKTFQTGFSPNYLTTGDFNGDGKTDLAVANAGDGTISILNNLQWPTITSFSPVSGPVGTTDTIKGTHFNTTPANNKVYFGATKATITTATDTSLIVTVPDGADYRYITVTDTTTGLSASSAKPFIVTFKNGGNFTPKVDYGTGSSPIYIASGDFNGDGIPDLAISNHNITGTVSILLGKSDGTFAPKVDYATGSMPESVIIGDFNGDGKLDLAITNHDSNTLSVLLGNGDGTFASHVDYATGANPIGVITADFNGDGIPDLAVVNRSSNSVSILLGKGDGTFNAKVDYTTDVYPVSVTTGDFNGDGKPDLAVISNVTNSVAILLGQGDGTFASKVDYTAGSGPSSITTGDFNGDGIPDLAISNWNAATVSILLGKGDGTFNSKVDYATDNQPSGLITSDLNGDGILDLAVTNTTSNTVSVLLGNGDGTFKTKISYTTGSNPYDVTTGDFNEDGRTDLAVINESSNTVSILDNIPFPPTITSFSPTSGPVGTTDTIKGTHFNTTPADNKVYFGATKAAVTAATDTSLIVTVPKGADYSYITVIDTTTNRSASSAKPFIVTFTQGGNFAPKVDNATGNSPFSVATGDFNGDGIPDLAVANYNASGTVSILLGKSDGTFAPKVDYATGGNPTSVTTGDFNGDGKLDLAVANETDGTVSVLLGNGDGTFATKVDYATGASPESVTTGDFNSDGKLDLAVANHNTNNVSVLLGKGDGTFNAKVDYTTGTGSNGVIAGDFNGDGKMDLAVADRTADSLSVLLGNGDGTFATRVDYATGTAPWGITEGDFNGDGKQDLAVANSGSNSVSVLTGKGDGTFNAKVDYPAGTYPLSIAAGDLNGDGKPDLAVSNYSSNSLSVLTNKGDGTFNAKTDYVTGKAPIGIALGDYSNDGKLDMAVTNQNDATVSVLNNIPAPVINTVSPDSAAVGNTVTIAGTNFNVASAVDFGSTAATSFTVVNNDTIKAVVGSGASGNVSVTTPAGTGSKSGFVFVVPPSGLSYKDTAVVATYGVAISNDSTTVSGIIGKYTISPTLPSGFNMDTLTGVISGTATVTSPKIKYSVVAHNIAGTDTTTLTVIVNKKNLTVTGTVTTNKVYDGNTNDTISGATLSGVVSGDNVSLSNDTIGTFAQATIGTGITVSTSMKLTGTNAGNYSLTQPSGLKANITAKTLTVTGTLTSNKVYDGNTNDSITGSTLSGVVTGDNVTLVNDTIGTFAQATIGTGIAVSTSMKLTGTNAGNYSLTQPSGLKANITAKTLTVTGTLTTNKVYDGNTNDTISGAALSGVVSGDNVTLVNDTIGTFAQATVGTGITVSTSMKLTGTDAGNYSLTQPSGLKANITAKTLTVTGTLTSNKIYDGNTNDTISGAALSGVVSGDNVTLVNDTIGTFAQANIGTGIAVSSAMKLTGTNAGNYTLTQPTGLTANIVTKELTVTGTVASNKVYDGNTTAALSGATLSGVVSGDVVSLTGATSGTFAQASVGNGITVTTNMSLTGANAGDYTLTQPSGLTADITVKTLTVTGTVASNKVYDGNTTATLSGATLSGVVSGDAVSLLGTSTGTFAQASVGNGIAVTTSMSLSGANAADYNLTQPSGLTANITKKTLTVTGTVVSNKVYDGNTTATLSGASLSGVVSGDAVSLLGTSTGTFAQASVGNGIAVTTSMGLSGTNAGDYSLTQPAGLSANITEAPLSIIADNQTKVYDSLTFSKFTVSYQGFVNGEDQSVLGGSLAYSGSAISATDAGSYVITPGGLTSGNYAITFVNGTLNIKKADQTISFDPIPEKKEGESDFKISATSSPGLPVTFSSSDNSIATVNGSTVKILRAGNCIIYADQAGNNNYNPAPETSQILTVIGFGNITKVTYIFSPNGDGINDYWKIPDIKEMGRVQVKIYDRLGSLVYQSSDYQNNWDGTYRGVQLPVGAYVCILRTEKQGIKTGVINLIR